MQKLVFRSKSNPMANKGLCVLLFVVFLGWAPIVSAAQLCLVDPKSDQEVTRFDTGEDRTFALAFIHSVSLTPVRDEYLMQGAAITQTREIFEAHGAGLPSFADDIGATGWQFEDGKFILEMQRPLDQMRVRIQEEYKNTLHIAGRDVVLSQFGYSVLVLRACSRERK
ncbi:DUF1850 domain-containing protein [Roseovarius aestuarii]|nr:DUF1850 domain-containing protein [Roseovarius aestuarii]